MSKVIKKIALLVGYLIFAAFSAYFTATSLSLNLMKGTSLWLIYIMVFVVALLAGWLLTKFIQQITQPTSKALFVLDFIGFIVFWGFSFTTNVHYFFVQKNGFEVLNKELIAAKDYLTEKTVGEDNQIDAMKYKAKHQCEAEVKNELRRFQYELQSTIRYGFGEQCITILQGIEDILRRDTAIYHDHNDYTIWDPVHDIALKGRTTGVDIIYNKYSTRVNELLKIKLDVIDRYYEQQKENHRQFQSLLDTIAWLERNDEMRDLRTVQQDGSVKAYYSYSYQQNAMVIDHMPQEFSDAQIAYQTIESSDGEEVHKKVGYVTYPSKHMFDSVTVWIEILKGYMPSYMTIVQWILISLIIDIVAFLLLFLFFKN